MKQLRGGPLELLRSLIFVPGNRPNMLERALDFEADIIMVDLEDSVPPAEKVAARDVAAEWVPRLRQAGQRVMVRCNSLDTGLTQAELAAVISPSLYGFSVGKTESTWDLQQIDRIASNLEGRAGLEEGTLKLVPWIESARAMVNINEMASASGRTIALAFGAEDFTNDMGIQRTDDGDEVYHSRCTVAIAARAAGLAALDSPYVAFRNPEGLRQDAAAARRMRLACRVRHVRDSRTENCPAAAVPSVPTSRHGTGWPRCCRRRRWRRIPARTRLRRPWPPGRPA